MDTSTRDTAATSPRDRVFGAVLEHGPVSAAAVAARLGVTPAAVRRHLDTLSDDGFVEARYLPTTGRRGRPARVFVVTGRGQAEARGGFDDLAVDALTYLADQVGERAVVGFAEQRVAELERRYAPTVRAAGPGSRARAAALAAALSADGFAASARGMPGGGRVPGTQLCQGHCPVHSVAARFPQLCEAETKAFSRLLGVHVQRLATIAHGEHVCTTFVPDASPGPGGQPLGIDAPAAVVAPDETVVPPSHAAPEHHQPIPDDLEPTSNDVPTSRKDTA